MGKHLKDIFQYTLAVVIVVTILMLLRQVFRTEIPSGNKDIALLIIGAMVAKFGDVVAYFFNSSKGSAEKTDIISKLPPLPSVDDTDKPN